MKLLNRIQQNINTFKQKSSVFESIKKHKTPNALFYGSVYTDYLEECRKVFQEQNNFDSKMLKAALDFEKNGFTSFWTQENHEIACSILNKIVQEEREQKSIWNEQGKYCDELYTKFPEIERLFQGCLGQFLRSAYRSNFKILHGSLLRSERILDYPTGSQLWHSDGGPGTCVNIMFYLKDVKVEDGALECLPWKHSLNIYKKDVFN
ncbi:MAG: hypothetical protein AAGA60_31570, partial [Cyanobacteria bacterium P01_E01_bin.42]